MPDPDQSQIKILGALAPSSLRWARLAIRRIDWELRPGAMGPLTRLRPRVINALTYKKTGEGDRTGLVPFCFLRSKRDEHSSGLPVVIGQGHNLGTFLEHPPQ